jgi:hypothetical protein
VRGVDEPPPGTDRADRTSGQRRIGEVTAAVVEPATADPRADRGLLRLEDPVQVAQRDVMRGGDLPRCQPRVAQLVLDEALDLPPQRPQPRVGRERVDPVEPD